jgi:ABC-2 type transport system permease protein
MRNVFLIARREYLERVRTKGFLFMTIFIPGLMFGVIALPSMIATRMSGSKHLVVAAADLRTAQLIREELLKPAQSGSKTLDDRDQAGASRYSVDVETDVTDAARATLIAKVKAKQLDGVLWATDDALAANKVPYFTRDVSGLIDHAVVQQSLSRAVHRRILQEKGLSGNEIDAALKPVDMEALNPAGIGPSNPVTTFVAVLIMVMIMYMTVLFYGSNVMRAIVEEKTSRIMEVMLSTANANEMMAGKILGVGAVGLTQIGIWTVTTGVLSAPGLIAGAEVLKGVVSLKVVIFFPVFFLLGFTLFSTLYAAVGAMVNSEQEGQQLQFLVAMPLIASVIILLQVLQNPATPLALWASIFPLTAPLLMFTRIALDPTVPSWQIAASIALLLATIYGLMILCGRIYRIGILMYGKKPTLPEILKWIKYA